MAFTPYAVVGADLDGLPHLDAIQVLLTQLAAQSNAFAAQTSGSLRARITNLNGVVTTATTPAELAAVNPTPLIQSLTENQLTGQLTATLSIPIKNVVDTGVVETTSRLSYGADA